MHSCCCTSKKRAYMLFALSIWIEVCCGLIATIRIGLSDDLSPYDYRKDVLVYVIVAVDTGFGLWLFCFTLQEILSRIKKSRVRSPKINWLFVVSTIVTFSVFLMNFYYNERLIDEAVEFWKTFFRIFTGTVYLLPLIYMILSATPIFRKPFPCIIFLVWIQMGFGLIVTNIATTCMFTLSRDFEVMIMPDAWAFAVFSVDLACASIVFLYIGNRACSQPQQYIFKKPIVAYWICGVSAVATSAAFGLIWAQNAIVLWENGIPKLFTNVLAIYIYSAYLLTLLECIPDTEEEVAIRDDDEENADSEPRRPRRFTGNHAYFIHFPGGRNPSHV